jgi:hypothetical protein
MFLPGFSAQAMQELRKLFRPCNHRTSGTERRHELKHTLADRALAFGAERLVLFMIAAVMASDTGRGSRGTRDDVVVSGLKG